MLPSLNPPPPNLSLSLSRKSMQDVNCVFLSQVICDIVINLTGSPKVFIERKIPYRNVHTSVTVLHVAEPTYCEQIAAAKFVLLQFMYRARNSYIS